MKFLVVGLIAALASVVSAAPAEVINQEAPETRHPHPHPTPSPTTTTTSFTFIITTIPGHPTTTEAPAACPTVTHTTRPADCQPLACPVPGCTFEKELFIPCGCSGVKTALFIDGCQTACPGGCITRLKTATAVCATATPSPA
ncbi:hypothetical protein F4819DRAFT_452347 [Hypoxylon fuscum]|nr:hypothetical protein F4819DRAFT_452347 [Hypoxylon fuscum]